MIPKHDDVTANARLILSHAKKTVSAFDEAFETVRKARGVTQGAPTDAEQDLLRAALVLAGAGLDSLTKQLIREILPVLLNKDERVQRAFEDFAANRIKANSLEPEALAGARFLARLVAAASPRDQLIREYTIDLTRGSLQSVDELFHAAAALGLDTSALGKTAKELKPIFDARNQIIHELDIDLAGTKRKRRKRTRDSMLSDANALLLVGEGLILQVEAKLGIAT